MTRGKCMELLTLDQAILWALQHARKNGCGVFGCGPISNAIADEMLVRGLVLFDHSERQLGWSHSVRHYRVTELGWSHLSQSRSEDKDNG